MYRVPVATYRIQFNSTFKFEDARRIVPYLAELGVTDLYSSPVLRARKGSTHGYDVVDAHMLNPELGTEDDMTALHEELQSHGLGFLLDTVPNHMAASHENAWWMSVLENGPNSRFVHYFDIDFRPITVQGQTEQKVLLPILGKPYGEVVESGEINLNFDADGFFFTYFDKRLPLAPKTYGRILRQCLEILPKEGVAIEIGDLVTGDTTVTNSRFLKETLARIHQESEEFRKALESVMERLNGNPGDISSFDALDSLLDAQYYRLAYWRIASEKINYRRFFDVTDLVGVRIENPEVFEARYRRILELVVEGKVTGLRIDHIDGLYDPFGHMAKMQLRLARPVPTEPAIVGKRPFYIVVEKILAEGEELPKAFEVSGTTGYDFLDSVNTVFVDPDGLAALTDFYRDFTGVTQTFQEMSYERKKQVIQELFSGEMRSLGKQLGELSMHDRNARDFAPIELLNALTEITASMPVYRTYVRSIEMSETDREYIRQAITAARENAASNIDPRLFTFLELVLLMKPPSYLRGELERWAAFIMRWQQFTGRVMAKGVEDTSFYNYNRLISLNEVGGEPGRDGYFDPVQEFHERNERIQRDWPHTMNATSTHDTKRSEDVRARISVLSEDPEWWQGKVREWQTMNSALRPTGFPEPNEELLIYQTLIGMWPLEDEEIDTVPERLRQYLEKAAREAKTHTNWITPDVEYEKALQDFGTAILENAPFRDDFVQAQRRTAYHGFINSLAQLVLKLTAPGAPDFYQGSEIWDLSLVDPDNRRPVDYDRRSSMLKKLKAGFERGSLDIATMLRRFFDGRVKLFVTWRGLDARARHRDVFRDGTYQAMESESPHVVAFMRGDNIFVAVPRLTSKIAPAGTAPIGDVWGDMIVAAPSGSWKNIFTGDTLTVEGDSVPLAKVFERFPVAVFERV